MPTDFKNIAIFFSGLLVLVIVLVAGTNFLLRRVPTTTPVKPTLPANDTGAPFENSPARINPAEQSDPRPIIYTPNGFAPQTPTVQVTDAMGCLITLINRSETPLRVGVNPHSAKSDPGANYGTILPGESGILDVRYIGFNAITLHNHSKAEQEFSVKFGEGCK